jgi:diguanylate cyclase (GGDEF)-like protein
MKTTSLEDFFDNLDEIVVMSDPDTQELVYANKFARQKLGLKPDESPSRVKCFEVLHDSAHSSESYDASKLRRGQFSTFDYYDPVSACCYKRKVTLADTHEHGTVRLEIAVNFNESGGAPNQTEELTSYVRITNEAMVRALLTDDPDVSINEMLSYLGESYDCDRAYIFEYSGNTCSNTYEWCRSGVSTEMAGLQNVPNIKLRSWSSAFISGTNIIINDIEEYKKKDPEIYEVLKPQGINTLVVGPIFENRRLIGFYGLDNPPAYRTANISTSFKMLSHFMAVMIRNRNNVRKLTNYSYFDQMTEVCNRHGLDALLKNRDNSISTGLVLCDLNGLKALNDTKGHVEGDRFILSLSNLLSKLFGDNRVFRMGGDEFLIMIDGGTQEQLDATVADLKKRFAEAKISVAVGGIWKAPGEFFFDRAYYGERRHNPWPNKHPISQKDK